MTVAALIAWLQQQPQDAEVHLQTGYSEYSGPHIEPLVPSMLDAYIPWPPGTPGAYVTLAP